MLYLSRLYLDNTSQHVRSDLSNCHDLHKTILSAFSQSPSGRPARDHFGVLFRTEAINDRPSITRLLLQSSAAPDWAHLPDRYIGDAPEGQQPITLRPLDADYRRIGVGMRFLFRLRVNPTKRISDRTPGRDDPLVGKRVDLLREEDQIAWMHRKGEQHGFRLLKTDIDPNIADVQAAKGEKTYGRRRRGDARMTFGGVLFNGRLEVINQEMFLTALHDGIGSGKAFGFGLLSIAEIG